MTTPKPRKLSTAMRATLEALEVWEGIIHGGTTSGEVMASGGARSSLGLAVRKGWARGYGPDYSLNPDPTPRYYRTKEGTQVLEADTRAAVAVDLVIEMDDSDISKYGVIHRAGCRDARDPEPLGSATTRVEAGELANAITSWDDNANEPYLWQIAPCAAKGLVAGETSAHAEEES